MFNVFRGEIPHQTPHQIGNTIGRYCRWHNFWDCCLLDSENEISLRNNPTLFGYKYYLLFSNDC